MEETGSVVCGGVVHDISHKEGVENAACAADSLGDDEDEYIKFLITGDFVKPFNSIILHYTSSACKFF